MLNIVLIEPQDQLLVSTLLRSQRDFRLHVIEPTGFTVNKPHKRSDVVFYRNWVEFDSRTPKKLLLRWCQQAEATQRAFDFKDSWLVIGDTEQGTEFRCDLADSVTAIEMITVIRCRNQSG